MHELLMYLDPAVLPYFSFPVWYKLYKTVLVLLQLLLLPAIPHRISWDFYVLTLFLFTTSEMELDCSHLKLIVWVVSWVTEMTEDLGNEISLFRNISKFNIDILKIRIWQHCKKIEQNELLDFLLKSCLSDFVNWSQHILWGIVGLGQFHFHQQLIYCI